MNGWQARCTLVVAQLKRPLSRPTPLKIVFLRWAVEGFVWVFEWLGSWPFRLWTTSPVGSKSLNLEPDRAASAVPGLFKALSVKSRATLTLAPGDYFIDALILEPQATLVVQGPVRLFVRSHLTFRGNIAGPGRTVITYGGTSDLVLESNFSGALVAPRAKVTLGAGRSLHFEGTLSARDVVLRPDVQFTCRAD